MTPSDQTSTSGPSYLRPWYSSGAAYGGDPQNVSSFCPVLGWNSFANPKSHSFTFMLHVHSALTCYSSICTLLSLLYSRNE